MPPPATDPNLHLDSLQISGFRGIPDLAIPRLGRVTLLAGKNGVGKTAVLNAVQMYAARCSYGVMATILRNRGEVHRVTNDAGVEMPAPDWNSLFYGRDMWLDSGIVIGPHDISSQMSVKAISMDIAEVAPARGSGRRRFFNSEIAALSVTYGEQHWNVRIDDPLMNVPGHRVQPSASKRPREIGCEQLGPGLPSPLALARFWDNLVIRDEQSIAVDALNLMLDTPAEWAAVVGDITQRGSEQGRRVIVKVAGEKTPVPLQSLGDGATRLLGVALAIANSRNGFLLIDEAENGIHHSIQKDFWNLVLQTAEKYNVQVLATTHSWDCVVGFAKATSNLPDITGMLYRIQRSGQRLRAVEYPESELIIAANYGIEVR